MNKNRFCNKMQQIEKSCSKLIAKIEECDIITKQAKAEKQRLRTKRGDMAQLVERRVRNAKARGSNPLISTKISQSYVMGWRDFFLQGDLAQLFKLRTRRLPCEPLRADACAITKASRSAFYESPYLHHTQIIRTLKTNRSSYYFYKGLLWRKITEITP